MRLQGFARRGGKASLWVGAGVVVVALLWVLVYGARE